MHDLNYLFFQTYLGSDIHLRNHLSVNPSSSSVLHPCSVCHCIHESNIQSLACHNLGSRPNVHPTGNSVSSYSRSTRNVHFNGTVQNRSQISTIPNDCTVMVVNSGKLLRLFMK